MWTNLSDAATAGATARGNLHLQLRYVQGLSVGEEPFGAVTPTVELGKRGVRGKALNLPGEGAGEFAAAKTVNRSYSGRTRGKNTILNNKDVITTTTIRFMTASPGKSGR